MNVTLELPDPVAEALSLKESDAPRRVLEALALEGYRSGELSRGQISEMLSLSFYETEEFLHEHQVEKVTVEEYEQDAEAFQRILSR